MREVNTLRKLSVAIIVYILLTMSINLNTVNAQNNNDKVLELQKALNSIENMHKNQQIDTNTYNTKKSRINQLLNQLQGGAKTTPATSNGNNLISKDGNTTTYNIKINPPIELDFLTKEDVYKIRKKYASMSLSHIDKNYSPSESVFGKIESKKPWWGQLGINCKGPGKNSIAGLSEESRFINNPLLLISVDANNAMVIPSWECTGFYPEPVQLTYQPGNKKISVVYDITNYYKNIKNTQWEKEKSKQKGFFTLKGINARDFGYDFAYAQQVTNVYFVNPTNLSNNVQTLKDYIHTGGSCGYPGGCNNGSPYQPGLDFDITKLPAKIQIKLWKQQPSNKQEAVNIYFDIIFK